MPKSAIERLNEARIKMSRKDPFLGFLAQHSAIILDDEIKTAATNGKNIYFSPAFMETLSDKDILFVYYHEVLHIALMHPLRKGVREHQRFNIACDIVINDYLKLEGFQIDHLTPIFGRKYKIRGYDKTAESVYETLHSTVEEESFDSHELWDELISRGLAEHIQEVFKKAYELGIYPSDDIARLIYQGKFTESIFKTKSKLKKYVEKYVQAYVHDYQFERIDKRYQDVLMPDFTPSHLMLYGVWFVVDVSYSMDKEALLKVVSEMLSLIKSYPALKIEFSYFSSNISEPVTIKSLQQFQVMIQQAPTTGATKFDVIFEKYYPFYEKKEKPKLIVIYTDGRSRKIQTKIPKIPILWYLTEKQTIPLPGKVIEN